MKFIQNNVTKKLMVVLIILLLFNALYPSMVYAIDLGGILLQPIWWLVLGIVVPADILLGSAICISEFDWGDIDGHTSSVLGGSPPNSLAKLFIGPDTIFTRTNKIT